MNAVTTRAGSRPPAKARHVRRATAVWVSILIGIVAATLAALATTAIDRAHRAPLGEWFSDFVKSPGLGGVSAVFAASLALWGILTQVGVTKRSLEHQREVDENRAWWDRFEWAAARAVPRSHDEVPLPYGAVLSTLTGLTQTANDDVQRMAVGAITEVASRANREGESETEQEIDVSHATENLRLDLLKQYAEIAGNSPARSFAVEAELYELQVIEALKRILPSDRVRTHTHYGKKSGVSSIRPDAIVEYKGKRIVVEIKNYTNQHRLGHSAINGIHRLVELTDADAVVVIAPIELRLVSIDETIRIVAAEWASLEDDGKLRTALDRVIE